jgi:hypothetical protein
MCPCDKPRRLRGRIPASQAGLIPSRAQCTRVSLRSSPRHFYRLRHCRPAVPGSEESAMGSLTDRVSRASLATIKALTFPLSTRVSRRCRPGRFKFMADSPPSTMTSNNSAPAAWPWCESWIPGPRAKRPVPLACLLKLERNRWLSSGHMFGNDRTEIKLDSEGLCRRISLAFELHRRDGCPESGILPYQEIDDDIERRTARQPASGRPSPAAESHQKRPRAPHKRRVAPGKPSSGKKASSTEQRPKRQKAAKQAKPAGVPARVARQPRSWGC